MASVKTDSELMDQLVAAIPVPHSSTFITVLDENGGPILLSLGNNGVLYAIKESSAGARVLIDLNDSFGISDREVVTFEAVQSAIDKQIYYSFAHKAAKVGDEADQEDGKAAKPNDETTLVICRPFGPQLLDTEAARVDLRHLIIPEQGISRRSVHRIFMSAKHRLQSYPTVVVGYVPLDSLHSSQDLARVSMQSSLSSWSLKTDVELPENAGQILDFCAASLPIGSGYFVLYIIQGQSQLLFCTDADARIPFKVALDAPKGARCLATVQQSNGFTGLLCGGQGLYFWSETEAQKRNNPGHLVSDDAAFAGVDQLFVAQSPRLVSVFASTQDTSVSYVATTSLNFKKPLEAVPLLKGVTGGNFSPFVSEDGAMQQLIVSREDGTLSLLQQDLLSQQWREQPFYVPDLNENIEFNGYMTRITVQGQDGDPASEATLLLACPDGWTEILANGRTISVGPDGTPVLLDLQGTLTLIIPSEDGSCTEFILSDLPGLPPVLNASYEIDPAHKVLDKMEALGKEGALREATLPDGTPLLGGSDASDDDIKNAEAAIRAVGESRAESKKQGLLRRRARDVDERAFKPGVERTLADVGTVVCGNMPLARMASTMRVKNKSWSFWESVKNAFKRGALWLIEKVKDGLNFLVEIAGEIISFAVRTLEQIGKALAFVFDKILGAIKKFIDFLKLLFDFKAILRIKDEIKGITNGLMDVLPATMDNFKTNANVFLNKTKSDIRTALGVPALSEVKGAKDSQNDPMAKEGGGLKDNSSTQYSNYQLDHGGAATHGSVSDESAARSVEEFRGRMRAMHAPEQRSLAQQQKESDITDALKPLLGGNISGSTFKGVVVAILEELIDLVAAGVSAGVEVIKTGVRAVQKLLNARINIPIFSALYRKITNSDLTLLDAACLVLAIPVHFVTSLLTGSEFSLGGLRISQLISGDAFGPDSGRDARVALRKPLDEDEIKRRQKAGYVLGYLNFIIRICRMFTSSALMKKPKTPGKGSSEAPGLTAARIAAPSISVQQAQQLQKFGAPHPLAYAARAGALRQGASAKRAGPGPDYGLIELLELLLITLNVACTYPLNPDDEQFNKQKALWGFAIFAEWMAMAESDKIPNSVIVINLCNVIVIAGLEIEINANTVKDEPGESIARIVQAVVDAAGGVCGIFELRRANLLAQIVSACLTLGLTIVEQAKADWNWMQP
ncbi:hypothetical protein RB593_004002 [Gaeumannomyces tritici]